MRHNRLLSSKRQCEIIELCRLERLVTAAGMGTAWLDGDTMDQATKSDTASVQAQTAENIGFCARILEDCHVRA